MTSNAFARVATAWRAWRLNTKQGVEIAAPRHIARGTKIDVTPDGFFGAGGTVSIAPGARLAEGAILAPYGGSIAIGANVYIGPYSVLYGSGGLTIGRNVLIASQCTIVASNHGIADTQTPIREQKIRALGITIGDDVWIGSGARILDGVTIGRGAVIGAGAVVAKSLPDFAVAMGVPAVVVRLRSANDDRRTASGG